MPDPATKLSCVIPGCDHRRSNRGYSRGGGSDRPCVPPTATDRERGSAPTPSEHPSDNDGDRDVH